MIADILTKNLATQNFLHLRSLLGIAWNIWKWTFIWGGVLGGLVWTSKVVYRFNSAT